MIADLDQKIAEDGATPRRPRATTPRSPMDVTDPRACPRSPDNSPVWQGRHPGQQCRHRALGDAGREDEDEHWLNVIDVNLNGTFWCCRAFGKHMLRRSGAIVNIGSMSGFIVNKPQEQSYYNASKAGGASPDEIARGRMGIARRARQRGRADLHQHPAQRLREPTKDVQTWIDGTPMARLGEVDEVASVVLFLASDAASLITGSIVLVDGGYSCW